MPDALPSGHFLFTSEATTEGALAEGLALGFGV